MANLKTVSGTEISYKSEELSVLITSKVSYKMNGSEDFVYVTHTKDNFEQVLTMKLEGISNTFHEKQTDARAKVMQEEEKIQEESKN